MNIRIRLWTENLVVTRYFGSAFIGHATAEDMLEHFEKCCERLNLGRVEQLSLQLIGNSTGCCRTGSKKHPTAPSLTLGVAVCILSMGLLKMVLQHPAGELTSCCQVATTWLRTRLRIDWMQHISTQVLCPSLGGKCPCCREGSHNLDTS